MATRLIPACAAILGGYVTYNILKPNHSTTTALNREQTKTRSIRSHLSGNHPSVAGGDDCLSRQSAQLRSHASSADSHVGDKERRKYYRGTVIHESETLNQP
jgi:hypothetical protein